MVKNKSILKDTLREISFNKKRFILLLLIIMIGTGLFVGLKSTAKDMKQTSLDYYNKTNLFDIELTQKTGFVESDVDKLKSIQGIKGVMLTKSLDVLASTDDKDYTLRLNSISDNKDDKKDDYINHLILTDGTYPKTVNEGLVDEAFLKDANLKIGDLVTLEPESDNLLRAKKIKIVGSIKNSLYSLANKTDDEKIDYYMYLPENDFTSNHYNYAYITLNNANKYDTYKKEYENYVQSFINDINNTINEGNKDKKEQITNELNEEIEELQDDLYRLNISSDETLKDEKEAIKKQINQNETKLSEIENDTLTVNTRNNHNGFYEYEQEIKRIENISKVVPLIFLLMTILVIVISTYKMILKEKNRIATLRSLGYTTFDILFKYILYALLASLIGSILGSFLFCKVIPLIIGYSYSIVYDMPNITTNLQMNYVLFSILFSVLTSILLTTLVFILTIKNDCLKLIKSSTPKKEVKKLENNNLFKKLGFLSKLAFKNVFRCKKITFITVIITCFITILLLVSFGYKNSSYKTINNQFNKINKYDIKIDVISNNSNKNINEIIKKLDDNKNIKQTKKVYSTNIDINTKNNNDTSYLMVIKNNKDLSDFINLKTEDNKNIKLSNDGVIISSSLANKLNLKVNDKITINLNNSNFKVKVSNIFKNYIDNNIYMSNSLYEKLTDKKVIYNSILLINNKLSNSKTEDLKYEISNLDNVLQVTDKKSAIESYQNMISSVNYVSYFLSISTIILAFIILYYLSRINISERKNEIVSLKQLGFYDKEIINYLFKESLIATIIGILIGLVFGSVISYLVMKNFNISTFIYSFNISIISYLLSIIIIIIILLIIYFILYYHLKKINIADEINENE